MKFRKLFGLSIVLMMLSVFFIGTLSVKAAESYKIKATYGQTEARTMLEMINNFRTGADAWQWDQNGNKVDMSGNSPLVYDYNLEKIAMLRAIELIASYSHTRPNGSRCFTAYTGSYSYKAENIAIGTGSLPAEKVFTLWREDDEDYSGQGHRRNMLNRNLGAVGIAHVYYNGCHYWVQEFGNAANDTNEDLANDSETEVEIMVDPSGITEKNIGLHEESVSITVGENKDIPKAVIKFRTSGTWRYAPAVEAEIENTINWISSNQDIVRIDGKSMTGVEEGTAEITADYSGEKLTMTVTVGEAIISEQDRDLKNAVVTLSPAAFIYSGKENTPSVSVSVNNRKLTLNKDFTFTCVNNINAGNAKIVVKGTGEYTGTIEKQFVISPADISKLRGVVSQTKNEDGTYSRPFLTLYDGNILLKGGTDYTSEIKADSDGKTIIMYANGTGNYKGRYISSAYTLLDGKEADDPGIEKPDKTPAKIKLGKKKYIFKYSKNKRSFKLDVKVSGGKAVYKSNKAAVKVNKKGKVTIKGRFKGKAYITISAKGSNGNTVTKKVLITVKK